MCTLWGGQDGPRPAVRWKEGTLVTAAGLTQDEILAAVAHHQAVWDGDGDAVTVLSERDGSERGILDLVIDIADAFGQLYLIARHGNRDDMDDSEREEAERKVDEDPAAAVTAVPIDAYRLRAKTAQSPAVRELSFSVIGYLAMSSRATRDEVPQIHEMMRVPPSPTADHFTTLCSKPQPTGRAAHAPGTASPPPPPIREFDP
ncbi:MULTISPECIES: hypothetical protein [Streptomyces]|uniref:ANTAR domain-containing protein n=2 Tax=Streptomyces TaxID=1883 RepID=A0ABV9J4M4_9ACTN